MAGWVSRPGAHRLRDRKDELFAQFYSKTLNGVQSAIKAGYGSTYGSSAGIASTLIKRIEIAERIDYLLDKRAEKEDKLKADIQAELVKIAFANPADFIKFNSRGTDFTFNLEALEQKGGAINEISLQTGKTKKKSIKLNDKLRAIEILLKQQDDIENARLSLTMEKHNADMVRAGIYDEGVVEDDGFMEAMNDVADNMENDEFVQTYGVDDVENDDN